MGKPKCKGQGGKPESTITGQRLVYLVQGHPKDKGERAFREHSRCIFAVRCKESKRDRDSRQEASGGKHVTRARSWWKRGDVSACAAHTNMECWGQQDIILDDEKEHQSVKEAWEPEDDKDKLKKELQGLEKKNAASCLL